MMRGHLAALMLALTLGGCFTLTGEYDVPIHERYAIGADASPECVGAAKRASRWCIADKSISSDQLYSLNCTEAQWDYSRHCR